jgi:hypothetical protein
MQPTHPEWARGSKNSSQAARSPTDDLLQPTQYNFPLSTADQRHVDAELALAAFAPELWL